jgi:hypothetical protein
MPENDTEQKLAFLYKIIDDNQATIRFLDTKAAFGIALLGAMISKVLDRDQLVAFEGHGVLILSIFIAFVLLTVLSTAIGFRTVFPTINPAENVSFPDNLEPKFFIFSFFPNSRWKVFSSKKRFVKLKTTHADYCAAINSATAEKLESILAAEALKLSFIRQLKTDRLVALARTLIPTVSLFIILTLISAKYGSTPVSTLPTIQGAQAVYNVNTNPKDCKSPDTVTPQAKSKRSDKGSPKYSPKSGKSEN